MAKLGHHPSFRWFVCALRHLWSFDLTTTSTLQQPAVLLQRCVLDSYHDHEYVYPERASFVDDGTADDCTQTTTVLASRYTVSVPDYAALYYLWILRLLIPKLRTAR